MCAVSILIVEDESILALDIEDILMSLGYKVVAIATTSQEALSATAQFHPDLVLMDVRIQGKKDGIETAIQIWEKFHLPVIFLTASSDVNTLSRIEASPAYGFISKPFEASFLQQTIEQTLRQYRSDSTLD